jgi:hypothetical protein
MRHIHTMFIALWAAATFALLILGTSGPVFAQADTPAGVAAQRSTSAGPTQKLLDDVATLNENLVEFALAGNAAKMAETANAIEASLPRLRAAVPAATFTAIESRVRDQSTAVRAGNGNAVALAAVENYRLLQEAIDPQARVVPVQVPLLDYSGFKILALTKGDAVQWADINRTVKEAASFWKPVQPRIRSVALRSMVDSIMIGLADASASKDPGYTAFGAKMLLESVDLLEGQFMPR